MNITYDKTSEYVHENNECKYTIMEIDNNSDYIFVSIIKNNGTEIWRGKISLDEIHKRQKDDHHFHIVKILLEWLLKHFIDSDKHINEMGDPRMLKQLIIDDFQDSFIKNPFIFYKYVLDYYVEVEECGEISYYNGEDDSFHRYHCGEYHVKYVTR